MRTASSQVRTTNRVISIVLAIFLVAAGYTAFRAAILLGQLSSLTTQIGPEHTHLSQSQP
jgi:cell division protein FtsB